MLRFFPPDLGLIIARVSHKLRSEIAQIVTDSGLVAVSEAEGVLTYVEVGDQDKSKRWHEIRDCSRRAVRNSG